MEGKSSILLRSYNNSIHPFKPLIPSFASLPEEQSCAVDPPLLRLAPPLLITPSIEFDDSINLLEKAKQEKKARLKKLEGKLRAKLIPIGNAKQGTPIPNICLDPPPHWPIQQNIQKIHPPVDCHNRGAKFRQNISDSCTTRVDVIALKAELDKRMGEFGGQEIGLRRRQELYTECFDEIIRQVSVSCVERGQLLLAIRDELNVTFSAYESLLSSAIAYGIRRQLKHENNVEEWERKIAQIKDEILDITTMEQDTFSHFENKFTSQMDTDTLEFEEEYERLSKNNKSLKYLLTEHVLRKPPLKTTSSTSQQVTT